MAAAEVYAKAFPRRWPAALLLTASLLAWRCGGATELPSECPACQPDFDEPSLLQSAHRGNATPQRGTNSAAADDRAEAEPRGSPLGGRSERRSAREAAAFAEAAPPRAQHHASAVPNVELEQRSAPGIDMPPKAHFKHASVQTEHTDLMRLGPFVNDALAVNATLGANATFGENATFGGNLTSGENATVEEDVGILESVPLAGQRFFFLPPPPRGVAGGLHNDNQTKEEDFLAWEKEEQIWEAMAGKHRPGRHWYRQHHHTTMKQSLRNARLHEWILFACVLAFFLLLMLGDMLGESHKRRNLISLAGWLLMGVAYNLAVLEMRGKQEAVLWCTGYLLQFFMGLDNVFIFHLVVKEFKINQYQAPLEKVLHTVVLVQILLELGCYMGLAKSLQSTEVLQYLLGASLVYAGYRTCIEDEGAEEEQTVESANDSWVVRVLSEMLGDRLAKASGVSDCAFFVTEGGKICITMVGLACACLIAVNVVLDIDVTLTKIDHLPGQEYVCASSSALAVMATPDLYFIARKLFAKFVGLKHGIAVVLVYLGVQMLLHRVFQVTPLADTGVLVSIVGLSILISVIMDWHQPREVKDLTPMSSGPPPPPKEAASTFPVPG